MIEGGLVFDVQKPDPTYFDKPEHRINTIIFWYIFYSPVQKNGTVQCSCQNAHLAQLKVHFWPEMSSRKPIIPSKEMFCTISDCCVSWEVFHNGPLEYTFTSIYGFFVRQENLINGRPWYQNDARSIWWIEETGSWVLGSTTGIGGNSGFAFLRNIEICLPKISNQQWELWDGSNFIEAGDNLIVQCGIRPEGYK